MRLKVTKDEGAMILLEEGEQYAPSLFFCFIRNFFKAILCASEELKTHLPDKDFIETIKDVQGISYDENKAMLTVTENLPEIKFRYILYWLRIEGCRKERKEYSSIAVVLVRLFEKTHQRYFFKKSHMTWRREEIYNIYSIEGGGIFSGHLSPEFWLEWKATFKIIDKFTACKTAFWCNPFSYLEAEVNTVIRLTMAKYMFEVGDKNSCSMVYEIQNILDKKQENLPEHKYWDLRSILREAKDKVNQMFIIQHYSIELEFLSDTSCWPLQRPYLGLWEFAMSKTEKAVGGIVDKYRLVLSKIKATQLDPASLKKEFIETEPSVQKEIPAAEEIGIDFYRIEEDDREEIHVKGGTETKNEEIISEFKKRKQTISLLRFWLESRSRIHWLHGFIMFENWRKGDLNHMNAFSQCMSHLRNLGTKTGLWTIEIASTEKGDILKKGHWELKGARFSSNIFEAQKLFDEAVKCKEDLNKKTNLIKACEAYPEYLDAYLLLAGCWGKEEVKNLNPDEIKKTRRFFVEKEAIYSNALTTIIQLQLRDKEKESYWTDRNVNEVIDEMHEVFLKINHFAMVLRKEQKIISPEEETCERIKLLVENKNYALLLKGGSVVKKAIGNALYHLGWEEIGYDREVDLINALTEIYKEGEVDTEKAEMINKAYEAFVDLIINSKVDTNCLRAGDLEGFKKYLTATLLKDIKKITGKEHPLKEIVTDDPRKFAKKSQEEFLKDVEDISEEDTSENTPL